MWASRFNKKCQPTSKVQQKHEELKWLMVNSDQNRRFNRKIIKDWPTSQTKAPGSRSMRNCFTLGQGRYRESEKFAEIWKEKKWNHWEVCRNLKKKNKDWNHWEVCGNLKRQRSKSLRSLQKSEKTKIEIIVWLGTNPLCDISGWYHKRWKQCTKWIWSFCWKQLPYS